MRVCVLGSGSSGNSTLVDTGSTCVLVDLGFGPRSLVRRLRAARLEDQRIDAILLTHGHSDHTSGVGPFVKKCPVPVYATRGTFGEVRETRDLEVVEIGGAHGVDRADNRIEGSDEEAEPRLASRILAILVQSSITGDAVDLLLTAPLPAGEVLRLTRHPGVEFHRILGVDLFEVIRRLARLLLVLVEGPLAGWVGGLPGVAGAAGRKTVIWGMALKAARCSMG